MFLAVQNSSIGDLVPWLVGWSGITNNQTLQSDPRDSRISLVFDQFETRRRIYVMGIVTTEVKRFWPRVANLRLGAGKMCGSTKVVGEKNPKKRKWSDLTNNLIFAVCPGGGVQSANERRDGEHHQVPV